MQRKIVWKINRKAYVRIYGSSRCIAYHFFFFSFEQKQNFARRKMHGCRASLTLYYFYETIMHPQDIVALYKILF